MTTPISDLDFSAIMPRYYVLRPVTEQLNVKGRIVAGKRPGDTNEEIKISAGVHQFVIDYKKNRWYSVYGPDGLIFGEVGPSEAKVIRAVVSKPGTLIVFMSAPAAEQATTALGLTIIPGQAPV